MSRPYAGDLRCAQCGQAQSCVLNTYGNKEHDTITRRRQCLGCGSRFTTHERTEDAQALDALEDAVGQVDRLRAELRAALRRGGRP